MSGKDKLDALGVFSPEESVAKAIERLSTEDKIKMMANLKSGKDVQRFTLMYNVGGQLGLEWMTETADNMLMLTVSLDKGRGRKDVVEVVKQPAVSLGEGITGKIKSFIKSE